MKKSDLKRVLKPIVKECIHEVLLTEGILSNIIVEVATGLRGTSPVLEEGQKVEKPKKVKKENLATKKKLQETRKMLLEAVNKDAYNGIDIFKDTTPTPSAESAQGANPLAGKNPADPGVDISALVDIGGENWSKLL
tara:strand:- start:864 stop:1274 length:411 start_codon:yes stop_codon:yes gene_type:complete